MMALVTIVTIVLMFYLVIFSQPSPPPPPSCILYSRLYNFFINFIRLTIADVAVLSLLQL